MTRLSLVILPGAKQNISLGIFHLVFCSQLFSGQLSSDMQQKFKQIGVVEETFDEKEVKSGALESCACILRRVRLFVTLWTVTHQAPLSVGFSRQEYGSGLPFHPPGDLSDPRIKFKSLVAPALQAYSLPAEPSGKPLWTENSP